MYVQFPMRTSAALSGEVQSSSREFLRSLAGMPRRRKPATQCMQPGFNRSSEARRGWLNSAVAQVRQLLWNDFRRVKGDHTPRRRPRTRSFHQAAKRRFPFACRDQSDRLRRSMGTFRRNDANSLISSQTFCHIKSRIRKSNGFFRTNCLKCRAAPWICSPTHRAGLPHRYSVAKIKRFGSHDFEHAAAERRRAGGIGRAAHD